MYRPSKLITPLLVFVCFAMNCYAVEGCFVPINGNAGRSTMELIYTAPQPGETPGKFYTTANPYRLNCPAGSGPSTVYAGNISDVLPSRGCWVEYKGGGTQYPNNYWQNGKVVNFDILQCPIDDYIHHLLFTSALVAVLALRRRI